jgi:hypothetical protein
MIFKKPFGMGERKNGKTGLDSPGMDFAEPGRINPLPVPTGQP